MSSDLNDIQAFVRVVEEQSFSGAARRLSVPVSSLSRRVARLEEEVGVRLLNRTTRRLHLTDAGRVLFQRAAHSLSEIDEAERALALRSATPRGRLRMTAPVDFRALLGVVLEFLEAYPEVQIDLDLSNRQVDLIGEGYDLAVRASALIDDSLIAQRVSSSGVRLVASPAYLERRGTPKTLAELGRHDCVILGSTTEGAHFSLTVEKSIVRVPVSGRVAINSLDGVRQAVLSGFGIGLLPERTIAAELESGALREVLSAHWPPPTSVFLVYPSRRLMSSALRTFVDHLLQHLLRQPLEGTWSARGGGEGQK